MKRVIFVDDEQNILNGLKRMLRPMRHEWEMHFANSALEALEQMSQNDFDVVVSDMRMPRHDGAYLLSEVREHYPAVARIILSGHAEQEMAIRSVAATHQFLAKPCDAETLRATVERTCRLRGMMQSDRMARLTAQIGQLPSVPAIYQEMNVEMGKEEPSMQLIATIVSKDLAMTAKILQLVNSAFFGLRRHVSSIEQAVAYLGMELIRSLVTSQSAFRSYDDSDGVMSAESLMRHGLLVAGLAKEIAKSVSENPVMADEAFQASMMHGLGKLILGSQLPEEYATVSARVAAGDNEREAEKEVFGVTHAEVGAYLLGLWGLSDGIVEAIAYHSIPETTAVTEFAPIVALHVATSLIAEDSGDTQVSLNEEWLAQLGLDGNLPQWRSLAAKHNAQEDAA